MGRFIDLTGKRFGRLIVICEAPKRRAENGRSQRMWLCQCDCGKQKEVFGENLRCGKTLSCGCLHKEIISKSRDQTTHNGSRERLYGVWASMIKRCTKENNPAFNSYGGRGICVCDEWMDYAVFRHWALENGYYESSSKGECTLDRINVNGDYRPDNCRWVSMKVQGNNRRNNLRYTYNGESHTIFEWSNILGFDLKLVRKRLSNGWEFGRAIKTPKRLINSFK